MSASSSDSENGIDPRFSTPSSRQLQARTSSPINERRAMRKRKRRHSGFTVFEGSTSSKLFDGASPGDKPEGSKAQRTVAHQQPLQDPSVAFKEAVKQLPAGFAEDFFLGHGHAKLNRSLAANAASPAPLEASSVSENQPCEQFPSWLRRVQIGFSLLLHGVGSKRQLLQEFAEQVLKPSGIARVHMNAFDARFSLCECLRDVLEQVYPDALRRGTSADALGAAVRAAAAVAGARPICFVVHNLENLPQPHVVILSSLAASPGVHVVASVDNIWAPLAWDSRCLKDFNFCREEADTFVGYETEATARHPRGLPAWSGLGHDKRRNPKASLSLVLRSLTNNHRELVQAMAERQLESENRTGISMSALLQISTDRMIAASVPKLRSLLNELRDHEVVVQRGCSSVVTAQALFYLPFDERTLQRLQEGKALDSDDEGEEAGPPPGDDAGDDEAL